MPEQYEVRYRQDEVNHCHQFYVYIPSGESREKDLYLVSTVPFNYVPSQTRLKQIEAEIDTLLQLNRGITECAVEQGIDCKCLNFPDQWVQHLQRLVWDYSIFQEMEDKGKI